MFQKTALSGPVLTTSVETPMDELTGAPDLHLLLKRSPLGAELMFVGWIARRNLLLCLFFTFVEDKQSVFVY